MLLKNLYLQYNLKLFFVMILVNVKFLLVCLLSVRSLLCLWKIYVKCEILCFFK